MSEPTIYQEQAKNILRAELKRQGFSYKDLAAALGEKGVHETDKNIANKLSRGTFTAAFFLMALNAIGCKAVRLSDD
jgi:3-mercaptopyruvate sulfurtransferase SseA